MTDTTAPSYRLIDALLESLDNGFDPLRDRLGGLTDAEYLWEPAPGCWTVRAQPDGTWLADWAEADPDPAPVTTIAWRMWHLGADCFDSYAARLQGATARNPSLRDWTGEASTAHVRLDESWERLRGCVAAWGDDLWQPLGANWGPYARHARFHLAMHAMRELIHHAAEISLLRDLYRATTTTM